MTEEAQRLDLDICPVCGCRHRRKTREDVPYKLTSNLVCDVAEDDDEATCEEAEQEMLQPWQKAVFIILAVALLVIVLGAVINRGN